MVRIRLRRVGARNQPSYRIVAAEKESPRDGRFLEILGHYNPRTEPSTVVIDEARLFHWMKNGAQPSDAVVKACRSLGTWERWERYKKGEALETLLAEAEASLPEVDPRTRRDDLVPTKAKAKPSKKKEKPATPPTEEITAEEPAAEEPAAEEPEAEEPVAEEPAVEEPAAEEPEAEEPAAEEPAAEEPEAEEPEAEEPAAEGPSAEESPAEDAEEKEAG
jgi:small subunit ribosomal protein S16